MKYATGIELDKFFAYLEKLDCGWILSFDGKCNIGRDYTYDVPKDIYHDHIYFNSGNSSFRRLVTDKKDTVVYESMYIHRKE